MSSNIPCAACTVLRRRCTQECVFAPYFPREDLQKFIDVHSIYEESNIERLLQEIDPMERKEAVDSICYEASLRRIDPVYGSMGLLMTMQRQLIELQRKLDARMREVCPGPDHLETEAKIDHILDQTKLQRLSGTDEEGRAAMSSEEFLQRKES